MDLKTLQKIIDDSLEPHSFPVPGKTINIQLKVDKKEITLRNIFGIIEGSDPILRNEYIIYSAHFDHVGTDQTGDVYNGADDDASGSTALLEMAEAFMLEKNKIKRSIGFLWVSGEEIGLFGSKYYSDNPIIPLSQTAAVINLDMVGRTRTAEDTGTVMGSKLSIVGGDSIGILGGLQSKILMDINKQTLIQMNMIGDYTYNDPNHPDMYFYRSDHINFVRHDIPALCYSTGTHKDYHQPTDSADKIDYKKLKKVTDFTFMVGYNIANYKGKIVVDNPFSKWE
jgi:Zn-dependent M28 family amino/carboxypeptidase